MAKRVPLGSRRQNDLCAKHCRKHKGCNVAVMLVDQSRARRVAQQHPQPLVDAALGAALYGYSANAGLSRLVQ